MFWERKKMVKKKEEKPILIQIRNLSTEWHTVLFTSLAVLLLKQCIQPNQFYIVCGGPRTAILAGKSDIPRRQISCEQHQCLHASTRKMFLLGAWSRNDTSAVSPSWLCSTSTRKKSFVVIYSNGLTLWKLSIFQFQHYIFLIFSLSCLTLLFLVLFFPPPASSCLGIFAPLRFLFLPLSGLQALTASSCSTCDQCRLPMPGIGHQLSTDKGILLVPNIYSISLHSYWL